MCKIVYLTAKTFDTPAKQFRNALAGELEKRGIEVVTDTTNPIKRFFSGHNTYGIAIAIDFFRDNGRGCGLTLNKHCSFISRDFAYSLSNNLDILTPTIRWRDFKFVDSWDREWYKFFNKVSSSTKAIFYLCTLTNPEDVDEYSLAFDSLVKAFADEIVRCLRSDYDCKVYARNVRAARLKVRKYNNQSNE